MRDKVKRITEKKPSRMALASMLGRKKKPKVSGKHRSQEMQAMAKRSRKRLKKK